MTLSPIVSTPEKAGAERAIALLTAFCDGMSPPNPDDWCSDLFEQMLADMQYRSGLSDALWGPINDVLVAFLIMLDWALENEPDRFETIAYLAQLLHRSLSEQFDG